MKDLLSTDESRALDISAYWKLASVRSRNLRDDRATTLHLLPRVAPVLGSMLHVSTAPPEPLSNSELVLLMPSSTGKDWEAICALTTRDRAYFAKQYEEGTDHRMLLGGIRLMWQFSQNPYEARSHLKGLSGWVACAASAPLEWK